MGADPDNPNLLVYIVEISNNGFDVEQNVNLEVRTPDGTRFDSNAAVPPAVRQLQVSPDGRDVTYTPVATLRGGETVAFHIRVSRVADPVGNFRARVTSSRVTTPIYADDRS